MQPAAEELVELHDVLGRYGAYHDLDTWRDYMTKAGFVEIEHYYRPADLPREQQPSLASVWRRRVKART